MSDGTGDDEAVHEFEIEVPTEVLDDLAQGLRRTRWSNGVAGAEWDYGTNLSYLRGLCGYWADNFDWAPWQDKLNRWTNIRAGIFGQPIHALVAHSPHPDATPLLLLMAGPALSSSSST